MENKIELLNCSQRILDKYRDTVRGNKEDSYDLAKKKITRNYILGRTMYRRNNYEVRHFGKLVIKVDLDTYNVVDIINSKRQLGMTYFNPKEKEDLNLLLGIE
jgi:hypothetical protein